MFSHAGAIQDCVFARIPASGGASTPKRLLQDLVYEIVLEVLSYHARPGAMVPNRRWKKRNKQRVKTWRKQEQHVHCIDHLVLSVHVELPPADGCVHRLCVVLAVMVVQTRVNVGFRWLVWGSVMCAHALLCAYPVQYGLDFITTAKFCACEWWGHSRSALVVT